MMSSDLFFDCEYRIGFDWVRCTFPTQNVIEIFDFLGTQEKDWFDTGKGLNFYKSRFLFHGETFCFVLADGINSGMGVNLTISGSALGTMIDTWYMSRNDGKHAFPADDDFFSPDGQKIVRAFFKSLVDAGAKFTRVDIAYDEMSYCRNDINYYPYDVLELYEGGYVSTNVKSASVRYNSDGAGGSSLYFGSRSSDCMLRIYDKQVEQEMKTGSVFPFWVRWEFELKHEYADNFVKDYLLFDISSSYFGLLGKFLRIVDRTSDNVTRCETNKKWLQFLRFVDRDVVLYKKRAEPTLDDSAKWIAKQVVPTLLAVAMVSGNGLDWVSDMLIDARSRLCGAKVSAVESVVNQSIDDALFAMTSGNRYNIVTQGDVYYIVDTWYRSTIDYAFDDYNKAFSFVLRANNCVKFRGTRFCNESKAIFDSYIDNFL